MFSLRKLFTFQKIQSTPETITPLLLSQISGKQLEETLTQLALVGGKKVPEGMSVSRLTLSPEDFAAREKVIKPLMKKAGLTITEHPLGIIGIYPGTNPNLTPIVTYSHFDSVPNGGMYDGDVGVIGAIEIVRILYANHIKLPRAIIVVAFSGEEASRFNIAHVGSISMFLGLTDAALDTKRTGDKTLREVLEENKQSIELVKKPLFGTTLPKPYAALELHVDQNGVLEKDGKEIGIVDSIAGPARFNVTIKTSRTNIEKPSSQKGTFFEITVSGKGGHSGGTPMGKENRADALVALSQFLFSLYQNKTVGLSIESIHIIDEAINKVPQKASATIQISGDLKQFEKEIEQINKQLSEEPTSFGNKPITVKGTSKPNSYSTETTQQRTKLHIAAISFILTVHTVATAHKEKRIVGTIGTYTATTNTISMSLDIRGVDLQILNAVIDTIKKTIEETTRKLHIPLPDMHKPLPGSCDPTPMHPTLMDYAKQCIENYQIGSYEVTYSRAGHDSQRAGQAGIPTSMLFCPSRNSGMSHNPKEYSTPKDLEKGTQALAALMIKLACEENNKL